MRFRLRTLMILAAVGPAVLAWIWFRVQEGSLADTLEVIVGDLWVMGMAATLVVGVMFVAARLADALTGKR